ncbi:MAG: hypothetical protein PHC31_07245 [Clostridia bacterium]|nr:hypothetical protein [Clostridia bacterium]MDD3971694.1 hypothetical protein [Clostridia bacterium]
MIENITVAAKMKALIAIAIFILAGGIYVNTERVAETQQIVNENTVDIFTKGIIESSDLVQNSVMYVVDSQGKQSPIAYKQLCESSMTTIRSENLDTEYNYNTLDASQKELIQSYRVYLQEAADVVVTCYTGETPDLTKMEAAKAALN